MASLYTMGRLDSYTYEVAFLFLAPCGFLNTFLHRALTSILIKYQYTCQVLVFRFPITDTDTSYFKNVLEY